MLSTILSVLLFVLKLIGFLLLFLLALLLIILFVPIRYRFEGEAYEEKPIGGHVQVTWLLHFISVQVYYLSKTLSYDFKLFGIVLVSNRPEFLERKKQKELAKREKKRKKAEKKKASTKEETPVEEELVVQEESLAEEELVMQEDTPAKEELVMQGEIPVEEEIVAQAETPVEEEPAPYNPTRQPTVFPDDKTKKEQKEKKKSQKDLKSNKKQKAKKEKKKESGSAKEKKKLSEKVEDIKAKMEEYQVMALLSIFKKTLIRVLKHVLPRKLEGYLHFGFDDPSTTGRLTGYAAMFYPFYHKTLTLKPDFQEKCIEGDLKGCGRIRIAFFLWILITLIMKKEIRNLIRMVLK